MKWCFLKRQDIYAFSYTYCSNVPCFHLHGIDLISVTVINCKPCAKSRYVEFHPSCQHNRQMLTERRRRVSIRFALWPSKCTVDKASLHVEIHYHSSVWMTRLPYHTALIFKLNICCSVNMNYWIYLTLCSVKIHIYITFSTITSTSN